MKMQDMCKLHACVHVLRPKYQKIRKREPYVLGIDRGKGAKRYQVGEDREKNEKKTRKPL